MKDKNKRRISILVTAQTAYNLRRLADLAGYHEPGMIVDKLVRYQMRRLNEDEKRKCENVKHYHNNGPSGA